MQRRDALKCGLAGMLGLTINSNILGEDAVDKPRCGVKNINAAKLFKEKWGKNHLTYYMAGRDGNDMEADTWDNQFRLAFDSWSEITPLTFEKVGNEVAPDIIIDVSNRKRSGFGRSGGVLAWAEMPIGRNYDGQLWTVFDLAERWVLPDNENGIILRSVACHEIGHILGLDHSNDESALMYPYINDALKPREDDIRKIQKLYGRPDGEKNEN